MSNETSVAEKIGSLVDENIIAILEELKAAAYKHDYQAVDTYSKAIQRILSVQ